jgi:flagellar motor switch protein FliM
VTAPATNHLGQVRIRQLLAAVGAGPHIPKIGFGDPSLPATDPTPAATPYDWHDPHYFNAEQRSRLSQALGQVAARLAEIFTRSRGGACEAALKEVTQHFAGDLCQHLNLDRDYCLAFAPDQGPSCGFASIAPQTALTWVTWLLGDLDPNRDPGQALSDLEESLLSDLFTAALEAFLAPLRAHHNLKPVLLLCQGQPSLQFERTEEVVRIVFQINSAGQSDPGEIALILPCSRLATLAGKTAPATPPQVTPQELSRALMEHLQEVPVTLRVTLASTTLPLRETLDLSPGDILLLDQSVDTPLELVLDGYPAFRGRPARVERQYAVVIVAAPTAANGRTATAPAPQQTNERT